MARAFVAPRRPTLGPGRVLRLALAALAGFGLLWLTWLAAPVLWYRSYPPGETAFMAQRLAEMRAKDPDAQLRYQWVPYDRIAVNLKRAVIASEDAKFVEHAGFDWEGIEKAMDKNRRKGRVVGGGSTIT